MNPNHGTIAFDQNVSVSFLQALIGPVDLVSSGGNTLHLSQGIGMPCTVNDHGNSLEIQVVAQATPEE